ncbi:MAG: TonB-dependent receptor [Flammeovirgaceae bacterium]|nr:MAG: TonB-dependent receptor [Flammeovirgaceae bacterium]
MKHIITVLVLMWVYYFPVYAQEQKDTTYINPKNFILDETVVSASRWEQNIREVPNRITKISAATIQFQNPQTAADLLGVSNQVFIQKSQLGGGSPMIRGFATSRVLLVIDGVRMNNAIFRSGNVQNIISLDASTIDESEVIFGPGSVIYGSDAIGGVMDFHTLTPRFSENGKLRFNANAFSRYSSANNEATNHLNFTLGSKRWSWVAAYTHSNYDDLLIGSKGPDEYLRPDFQRRVNNTDSVFVNSNPRLQVPTGYSQENILQKLAFRPTENITLLYAFHYSRTSDVPRYDRLILKNSGGTFTTAEWYYGPQKWQMHHLQVAVDQPTAIWDHARFTLAHQDYSESRHTRNFGSSNRTNRFENVKALSVNADIDKDLSDRTKLFYGLEYVSNKVGSTAYRENINNGNISTATTRYPDGSTWASIAGYASVRHKLSDQFLLNSSARITNVQTEATYDTALFDFPFTSASLNNTALNGSVGLVYNPNPNWKLYNNLSSGFRAPNVDDIGKVFDSQPGSVVVPNPNLEPELAYNAELGTTGRIGPVEVDVAAYYTLIDNAIARAPDTFNGADSIIYDGVLSAVLSQQNISSVKVAGFQLGLRWNIARYWLLTSHLNYQKGKETYPGSSETYSPTHVAPLFGATHLVFSWNDLRVDLYSVYNGEISYDNLALSERADAHLYAKDANGNPYAPSWWTLNLKTSFQAATYLTVDAGIENMLDKRYRPYSSGISAPGRNAIITLLFKI